MLEEIIETLRSRSEKVLVVLDLPDEDDLVRAEEMMLMPIPRDFRYYLAVASDIVYGQLAPATVADPSLYTYLPEMAAVAWSCGLPRYLLPICETLSGGYYCIDPDGIVLLFEGGCLTDEEWENIGTWIEDVWLT